MTPFSASPGITLISLDDQVPELPVVGWLHTEGLNAIPLVPGHPGPMVSGEAIQFADSTVFDPASGLTFADSFYWRDDFENNPTYRPDTPIKLFATGGTSTVAPPSRPSATGKATKPTPDIAGEKPNELSFDGKEYAKTSFWHVSTPVGPHPDGLVFTLNPGCPAAVGSGVTKITRDRYFELRKNLPEVEYASLIDLASCLSSIGGIDDDDDEGEDLI